MVEADDSPVVWAGANWTTKAWGTTPEYLDVRAWRLERGSFFGPADVEEASKVCVIGQTVADNLFAREDPIGQSVRIRGLACEVIGLLARKGQNQNGQDQDDIVLMPISTVRRKLFKAVGARAWNVKQILISAVSADETKIARRQVESVLRQRHRTDAGQPGDPRIKELAEVGAVAEEAARTTTQLLASIAAISLIVGGIGIMNIMLVSVTERTREIGIRMAVGAAAPEILGQFLFEALCLTLAGGLVGMLIGAVSAGVLSQVMSWPAQLGWQSFCLGFVFSAVVGVVFGFYPALRAARLDPITALRVEA
jgi:putative ABC transport system permease protein